VAKKGGYWRITNKRRENRCIFFLSQFDALNR
jgi:hypothetical protein